MGMDSKKIKYSSFEEYPGLDEIRDWKRNITIKDVLMHRAGFQDSGHYHNEYFDQEKQSLSNDVR